LSIWFLRAGIILELIAAICLGTSLIDEIVGAERVSRFWDKLTVKIRKSLKWLLRTNAYRRMRLRPTHEDAPIFTMIAHNWLALLILLVLAIIGTLVTIWALTLNPFAIIIAIPFATLAGWAFARAWTNRLMQGMTFILFLIISPFVYGLLFYSVAFHAALLLIITLIAALHAYLTTRSSTDARIIVGGGFLFFGAALQLYYTF
jgi:hypothetical protein